MQIERVRENENNLVDSYDQQQQQFNMNFFEQQKNPDAFVQQQYEYQDQRETNIIPGPEEFQGASMKGSQARRYLQSKFYNRIKKND